MKTPFYGILSLSFLSVGVVRPQSPPIYQYYAKKNPDKAQCIVDLYKPRSEEDFSARGYDLLVYELRHERKKEVTQQRRVERIIFDTVNRECMKVEP